MLFSHEQCNSADTVTSKKYVLCQVERANTDLPLRTPQVIFCKAKFTTFQTQAAEIGLYAAVHNMDYCLNFETVYEVTYFFTMRYKCEPYT